MVSLREVEAGSGLCEQEQVDTRLKHCIEFLPGAASGYVVAAVKPLTPSPRDVLTKPCSGRLSFPLLRSTRSAHVASGSALCCCSASGKCRLSWHHLSMLRTARVKRSVAVCQLDHPVALQRNTPVVSESEKVKRARTIIVVISSVTDGGRNEMSFVLVGWTDQTILTKVVSGCTSITRSASRSIAKADHQVVRVADEEGVSRAGVASLLVRTRRSST